MHGNDTENRAVVHGLNTYVITNDTQNTAHHDDIVDAEWEDINPVQTNQTLRNSNANLSAANTQQQEKIINDLFNMAGPNETVSLTISRRPTVSPQTYTPAPARPVIQDNSYLEDTESESDNMMFILWMLLIIAAMLLILKIVEFVIENPVTVILGFIAVACLIGSYLLLRPKRGKHK